MINNIPNKLLKDEPKDKNDNVKEAVSVENIKIEEIDSSKFDTIQYSNYNIFFVQKQMKYRILNRVKILDWVRQNLLKILLMQIDDHQIFHPQLMVNISFITNSRHRSTGQFVGVTIRL